MKKFIYPVLILAILGGGCGRGNPRSPFEPVSSRIGGHAGEERAADAAPPGGNPAEAPNQKAPIVERKIIYTAKMDLVVSSMEKTREAMLELVKEMGGYPVNSDEKTYEGQPRHHTWTIRIPTTKFNDFLDAVAKLGTVVSRSSDSQDVTDQYYDTSAEIKNLEASETALRTMFERVSAATNAKVSDILEVKDKLDQIRGQINVRKGQLTRWDKLSSMTTITISLRDKQTYIPPTTPDFGNSISSTFWSSIEAMLAAGRALVLIIVAVGPWLLVIGILACPIWFFVPKRKKATDVLAAMPTLPPVEQD